MSVSTPVLGLRRRERAFFTMIAFGMAAVVFVGFARSFFLRPWFPEASEFAAPETVFYIHGALFAGWMGLLIAQVNLIRAGRVGLHRRLGLFGVVLAAAMVPIGVFGTLVAARRPGGFIGVPVSPLEFLAVPLFDVVLFGLFVGLAVAGRKDVQSHKRLMILATVNMLEAAIIRIPVSFIADGAPLMSFWLSDVFIAFLVAWDAWSLRRVHPVTLWAGSLIVVSQPLRLWISTTEPWLAFAGWAVGLLG